MLVCGVKRSTGAAGLIPASASVHGSAPCELTVSQPSMLWVVACTEGRRQGPDPYTTRLLGGLKQQEFAVQGCTPVSSSFPEVWKLRKSPPGNQLF